MLNVALSVYIERLRNIRSDYKRHVDYNATTQISQKIEAAQELLNQMNPVQLFNFNLLMNENLSVEVDRETG